MQEQQQEEAGGCPVALSVMQASDQYGLLSMLQKLSHRHSHTRLRAAAAAGLPDSSNGDESMTLLLRRKPLQALLPPLPASKPPLLSSVLGDLAPESLCPTLLGADSGTTRGRSTLPPRRMPSACGLRSVLAPLRGVVVAAGVAKSPALMRR